MISSAIQTVAEPIGFDIGNSDNVIQANLLNGFCRGLNSSMPNKNNLETQLCYISDKLDRNAEKVLLGLVEFIKNK